MLARVWARLPAPLRRRTLALANHQVMIGVVGLLRDDDGRVLILEHRFRPPHPWGLPGGFLERDEPPAEGLARELREELGIDAEIEPGVFDVEYNVRGGYVSLALIARALAAPTPLSREIISLRFVGPDEIPPGTYPHHARLIAEVTARRQ